MLQRYLSACSAVLLLLALGGCAPMAVTGGGHRSPAALSENEIRVASSALREAGLLKEGVLLAYLTPDERKHDQPADPLQSGETAATAVLLDWANGTTTEASLTVRGGLARIDSTRTVTAGQPPLQDEEYTVAEELIRADDRWLAALRARGIDNPDEVHIDIWAPGHAGTDTASGISPETRLARAISFYRGQGINAYARPIEGLVVTLDMNRRAVVAVHDHAKVAVAREASDFYDPAERLAPRGDRAGDPRTGDPRTAQPRTGRSLKPLHYAQPKGPSYTIDDARITWDRWSFHYALHPRDGLVLSNIAFDGRPILHRAAMSEMVVPYGDPGPAWSWRSAFDQGEYGLGFLSFPLERGRDVPRHATLLSAVFAGEDGEPFTQQDAIAVYEIDGGLLWKHFDETTETNIARRARVLVITHTVTVGNYDYAFEWQFGQDGTIEFVARLTGILLAKGVNAAECPSCAAERYVGEPVGDDRYGTLVAPGVVAVNHQHIFNVRLDFDIEGQANSVVEMNARQVIENGQPAGAIVKHNDRLSTEKAAMREVNPAEHRMWKIYNPYRKNGIGHWVGYAIDPAPGVWTYLPEGAALRGRASFVNHHFYATRYKPEETHAAGVYPSQAREPQGLSVFTADDELLEGQDVVAWYTFGVTHTPRVEEWPVMPAARTGFRIIPVGFFDRNPALDVE